MYKERKTMVRINPQIGRGIAAAAKLEGKHGYELLEEIALEYLKEKHPEIHRRAAKKTQEGSKDKEET